MNFIGTGEFGLVTMLLSGLIGYYLAIVYFSYSIIKNNQLTNFQKLVVIILFWAVPLSGFVIYPIYWFIAQRQSA